MNENVKSLTITNTEKSCLKKTNTVENILKDLKNTSLKYV